jgi:PAS domain S-box-containing protein
LHASEIIVIYGQLFPAKKDDLKQDNKLVFIILLMGVILIFLSDLFLPLGMAVGFAYIFILLVASRYLDAKKTIILASISSTLVIADIFVAGGFPDSYVLFNRILAVVLLWIVTYLFIRAKTFENKLRYSEIQYRTIVEATYEGILISDKDGFVRFANNRIMNLLGYEEEELIKKKLSDIFLAGDPLMTVLDKEISEQETSIVKNDGTSVLTAVTLIKLSSGTDYLVVIRDITTRKKTEEALQESQARLSGIVSSAMDAIITINRDQNIVLFNKSAEKLFGYTQEEILGKNISILLPMDIRDIHKQHVRNFGETGTTNRHMGALGAVRGLRRDGHEFPIEASISQVKSSGEKLYTVILRDITERELARQQLLESENRFRNMADNAPVLIWLSDENNKFIYLNQRWLEFTGMSLERAGESGWTENFHPDEKEKIENEFLDLFSRKEAFINEFRLFRADGTYRWILNHGVPRFTPRNQFNGFIGSCIDITERKLFEEQLNTSLREKEVLLKEVHHRVKNNLQIISSLLSLQSETINDDKMTELMVESQNRIKSMALIHEKLYQTQALARIDAQIYLTELIDNLINSYVPEKKSIDLNLDIENIEMDIDTGIDIGLIINELISNSLKYAFPRNYEGEKKLSVIFNKNENTGKLNLIVKDTGVGLKPGFDLKKSESLGLQLVTTLVEQLEGTISFYNENGTTVEIVI